MQGVSQAKQSGTTITPNMLQPPTKASFQETCSQSCSRKNARWKNCGAETGTNTIACEQHTAPILVKCVRMNCATGIFTNHFDTLMQLHWRSATASWYRDATTTTTIFDDSVYVPCVRTMLPYFVHHNDHFVTSTVLVLWLRRRLNEWINAWNFCVRVCALSNQILRVLVVHLLWLLRRKSVHINSLLICVTM